MESKFFVLLIFTLFLVHVHPSFSLTTNGCDSCSPVICEIKCNEKLTNRGTAQNDDDYFNLTLDSPSNVRIIMTPSAGADYDLIVNWTQEVCPTDIGCPTSDGKCCPQAGSGATEECSRSGLSPGTYYIRVYNYGGSGTYNLSLECEIIEKPIITSPESKTYYNNTVNLTTRCIGDFESYLINRTLDGDTVTLNGGNPVQNDTEFTEEMTLPLGDHDVLVTYINGSLSRSSDTVHFSLVQPYFEFKAWAEGPGLFTIGRGEIVGIYVQNNGNMRDSYTIDYNKSAEVEGHPGQDFSHLIDVSFLSNKIGPVEPNRTGYTFATITLLGPISSGSVTFNITSVENSSVFQEIQPVEVNAGMPVNLPEFGHVWLIVILVVVSALSYFVTRINGKYVEKYLSLSCA